MSTPTDEGDNPYGAPEAELREDLPPREWRHVFLGMGAGLLGTALVWQQLSLDGTTRTVLALLGVLAAGLVLSRFRQLRPAAALVLGFPLTLLCLVGLLVFSNFLGIH